MKRHRAGSPAPEAEPDVAALRARYVKHVDGILALSSEVDERIGVLEKRESTWHALMAEAECNISAARAKIDLNVGGRIFATTKDTLLRWELTYFHAMLGSGLWEPCDDGAYFIDRSPTLFERIMDSLRTGEPVDAEGLSEKQAARLAEECDYFQLGVRSAAVDRSSSDSIVSEALVRWDAMSCSSSLVLSEDRSVVARNPGNYASGAVLANQLPCATSFRVRILSFGSRGGMMVGFTRPDDFSTEGSNYNGSGYFIRCGTGSLWSPSDRDGPYSQPLKQGDVLEARFDATASQICFLVNGQDRGVAFSGISVSDDRLCPCVELWGQGASLSLVD